MQMVYICNYKSKSKEYNKEGLDIRKGAEGKILEPRCEKTCLCGFRPGPTQTGLCSHKRWLEA